MRSGTWLLLALMCLVQTAQATVSDAFLQKHRDHLGQTIKSLDTSIPEMQEVAIDWEKGQLQRATTRLVEYFRRKQFDLSRMGPADIPPHYMEQAIAAKSDTFLIHGSWIKVPRISDNRLDWEYTGVDRDKEIAWMLNRHGILPIVAEAWNTTQDQGLKVLFNSLLTDWIENSPYPDRITFSAQWRPLEAARRVLNSWIHCFYGSPAILDDETLLLVLVSVPDHADALLEHASFWGGNHLLTEKIALLAVAVAWPEFRQSGSWRASAMETVSRLLMEQFYPDGSYKELSNHYQKVVLSNTLPFLGLIKDETDGFKDDPAYGRILKMWEFFAWSMKPDGSGPVNNASDKEMNSDLVKSAWALFERAEWLGIATNGRQGVLPTGSPSRLFPWAGQVFMRNNWGKSADWIYFDAGPYGTAHQHVDRLHLSVTLNGRDLLSDSGRYTYQPGRWREYFKGPRSHSVVVLDGQPARQGPREVESPMQVVFQDLDNAVYASGFAEFNPRGNLLRTPVKWTRDVVYDKRGWIIVMDHVDAFRNYDLEVLWQFSVGVSAAEAESIVQASDSRFSTERVVSYGQDTGQIAGFFSPDYSQKIPAVQINSKFRIQSPATIAHVIQPPGTRRMTVETSRNKSTGAIRFRLFGDGSLLSEGEISTSGTRQLMDYKTYPSG